jgi:hypothetical protein
MDDRDNNMIGDSPVAIQQRGWNVLDAEQVDVVDLYYSLWKSSHATIMEAKDRD